jgi:phospholipid/cholesterol/gamma-HCH transport system substrate-binding protein
MAKKRIETLVGLFVLLGMVGLVFLALKAANLASSGGGEGYTLSGQVRQHRRPEGACAGAHGRA